MNRVAVLVLLLFWVGTFSVIVPSTQAAKCSWTGTWDFDRYLNFETMTLTQSGNTVTGTFVRDTVDSSGQIITGRVLSGSLEGTVPESSDPMIGLDGTYTNPDGTKGSFDFTMSLDCNSFGGFSDEESIHWSGKRTQPLPPATNSKMLSVIVATTLGDTYQPGEDVYFSGKVTLNGLGVGDASIEIVVSNSAGQSGTPDHKVSDSNGFYGSVIHLPNDIAPGTYTIAVTAHKDGYSDATNDTSFTVKSKPAVSSILLVTIELSQPEQPSGYKPGDTVGVYVHVKSETPSGNEPFSDAAVKVSVSPSMGLSPWTANLDTMAAEGDYDGSFKIPAAAPLGPYTITATASKAGFETGSGSTTLIVTAPGILVVSLVVDSKSSGFKPLDYVGVTIYVYSETASGREPFSDADVTVAVTPSIGLSPWPAKLDTMAGIDGVYDGTFDVPDDASPNTYTITATASAQGFVTASDTGNFIVTENGGQGVGGVGAVEAVGGGIAGVASGVGGPILVSKAASMVRGTGNGAQTTTEPQTEQPGEQSGEGSPGTSEGELQFTNPHEQPQSTGWEDEKDPVKRRKKRQEEERRLSDRDKWLHSLSEEDRVAETGRTMNGQSVQDEYVQIMRDRPDFMSRIDDQAMRDAKADGTSWRDDWIVSKASDGDLRAMSAAERSQYEQWIKRYDSFTRRHGSNMNRLPTADGRYDRTEFSSTIGERG